MALDKPECHNVFVIWCDNRVVAVAMAWLDLASHCRGDFFIPAPRPRKSNLGAVFRVWRLSKAMLFLEALELIRPLRICRRAVPFLTYPLVVGGRVSGRGVLPCRCGF